MSPHTVTPEAFLEHFPDHWVQYFDDGPARDRTKALATPQFDMSEAQKKQQQGCGVFFSPNGFDGMRRIENLKQVQAVFVDLDLARGGDGAGDDELQKRLKAGLDALLAFRLPPHVVVRTRNGLQAIWRTEPLPPAEGLDLFRKTEDLLVAHFGADAAAKDVTRVLRLPGFLHLKDPGSPFRCDILHDRLAASLYDLGDLLGVLRPPLPAAGPGKRQESKARKQATNWRTALAGVPQGERNRAAARVAGRLLAGLDPELWQTSGWGGLKEWNVRNRPPLPEPELRAVFDSIAGRERSKPRATVGPEGARTRAEELVRLAEESGAIRFLDQYREPHVRLPAETAQGTCKIRSKEFRQWLARQLWQKKGAVATQEVLYAAALTLEGRTRYGRAVHPLEQRVTWHEGAIWYDLADERGRAVRVTAQGWSVEERVPILFRRAGHQSAQVLPIRGRPLSALLPLVRFAQPQTGPLLLAYLVSCLVPDIPHPVALVTGPQGATKSTLCRFLRRLVDPTCLEGLSLPPRKELPQVLLKHWYASFDNVGAISPEISDILCRAVTGEGISRRQLFSDDEDVIYQFRRCVCLNGIHLSTRPDLLDRAVHFALERLPGEQVRDEASVAAQFESLRPELLGGLFDALAGAMKAKPALRIAALPRMADFACWAAAAAVPLGIGADAFLKLYAENIQELHEEAVGESPLAVAVVEFMAGRLRWQGTPTDLLAALHGSAKAGNKGFGATGLPRGASVLTRQLNLMRTNLSQMGITVETGKSSDSRREIRLRKGPAPATLPSTISPPRDDGPDGSRPQATRPSGVPSARSSHPQARFPGPDGSDGNRRHLLRARVHAESPYPQPPC